MAYRITADLSAREAEWLTEPGGKTSSSGAGNRLSGTSNDASSTVAAGGGTLRGGGAAEGGGGAVTATATVVDEEEAREAVFHRLESLGYRVGLGVVERYVHALPDPTLTFNYIYERSTWGAN